MACKERTSRMAAGTLTANGQTVIREGESQSIKTLFLWGTFGGGIVTLQVSPDTVEWFDIQTFHTKNTFSFQGKARQTRLSLAGSHQSGH